MDYLQQTMDQLLFTLFHSSNLAELVNHSERIIDNPIQVYNANYFSLAHTDMSGIDDPLWIQGKVGTNCLYEFASILNKLGSAYQKMPEPQKLVSYNIDDFGPHRRRIFPLVYSNSLVGYFIVLEIRHSLDDVPEECYKLLTGIVTKELYSESVVLGSRKDESTERVLSDLINGNFSSRNIFTLILNDNGISPSSFFRAAAINLSDYRSGNYKYAYLRPAITEIFPHSWSVLFYDHAVLLIDCEGRTDLPEKGVEALSRVMEASTLRAGVSDAFSDVFSLRQYCQQAIQAADIAKRLRHNDTVSYYDDYKLWLCADSIGKSERALYISNLVKEMAACDQQNGTQYVRTLFFYLETGKSLIHTAERMHLHRNTVVYRLERIKTLFGYEKSNSYHDVQNYLSCMLIHLSDYEKPGDSLLRDGEK